MLEQIRNQEIFDVDNHIIDDLLFIIFILNLKIRRLFLTISVLLFRSIENFPIPNIN